MSMPIPTLIIIVLMLITSTNSKPVSPCECRFRLADGNGIVLQWPVGQYDTCECNQFFQPLVMYGIVDGYDAGKKTLHTIHREVSLGAAAALAAHTERHCPLIEHIWNKLLVRLVEAGVLRSWPIKHLLMK